MAKIIETIKERSRTIWVKVKPYSSYLISLLLILLIAGLTYSIVKKDKKPETNQPEVAVNYPPRIGDALPPDVNPSGEPNATAPNPETPSTPVPTAPPANGDVMTAPHTGIDDDEPVAYQNEQWKFAATLPPRTIVNETPDGVSFTSKEKVYYTVSVSPAGQENLQSIAAQLKNSSEVKNVTINSGRITFTIGGQKGLVFIANKTVYYIIGSQYLETFHTI